MKTDRFEEESDQYECVNPTYNFFIIEYDKQEFNQFIRSEKQFKNFLLAAYFPEYVLTVPLYVAGTKTRSLAAQLFLGLPLRVSVPVLQVRGWRHCTTGVAMCLPQDPREDLPEA